MGPVLVLGDQEKEGVADAVEEYRGRLANEFGIAAIDLEGTVDVQSVKAEWALVFGGDGAILSAARRMAGHPIPTLSVNFGRFGFLTEIEFKQLPKALDRIKAGRTRITKRMRLIA
ncbi:MAG: NAD(+)/NADH kinase, partial [Planctomycetota bacterium]|nr:NAD(+)/NADH kinase [Planctomycetota bacterium]